ncbi:hypothetical protein B0H66DRAFT_558915 [Apodospora peruviana]|uniref:NmrA-like domain-containing protein n=1 Tax=Apodospora peruviana TaxID=516989 RepID=A0AAE0I5X1_9PEZI|nr:hypothetical protein B0H66DRAFT_558915 [Apodospora peruviana]
MGNPVVTQPFPITDSLILLNKAPSITDPAVNSLNPITPGRAVVSQLGGTRVVLSRQSGFELNVITFNCQAIPGILNWQTCDLHISICRLPSHTANMAVLLAKDQPAGFTNRIEKVAIVGAGGQIGSVIASALLQTGKYAVTAITRPDSTNKIDLEGLNIVRADHSGDDDSALVSALRGTQALIITMAVTAPRDTTAKLIAAAAKANVKYIFPNWFGHDPANDSLCNDSFLTQMRDSVRAEIARHGVSSHIFLACNFWYEFSLGGGADRFGFDFQNKSLTLFDDGDVPINTSTWPQCGRAVASLLSLKVLPDDENDKSTTLSHFGDKTVYISSFRLTQKDMFEAVKRVTGTTDADWTITRESAEQRWKEGMAEVQKGNFAAFTKMLYSRMFFAAGGGDYESKRGTDNVVLGLPVEDLDEATKIAVRMGKNGEITRTH